MSRRALNRGDYLMRKAAEDLIGMGYIVEKAKKVRWAQQDFFGCWDIIAIKEGLPIRFVQVSAKPLYDRGVEYRKKLEDFPKVGDKEYWWYKERKLKIIVI